MKSDNDFANPYEKEIYLLNRRVEELVKYKEMYQSIAGGANLNHLVKQNEEMYLALSWSCRRLMYVHECYPDLLGPITLDKIARVREDFNLEKK